MPDSRTHRGPGPEDARLFAPDVHDALRAAVADLSWLRGRGYAESASLKIVGDRYALVERQRMAVRRSACSDAALASRRSRQVSAQAMRGRPLRIDGFNAILTIEAALGGAVVPSIPAATAPPATSGASTARIAGSRRRARPWNGSGLI